MEEWVGQQWHRFITRAARSHHPEAAVRLEQVQRTLALMFRAGGGPAAVQLGAGTAQAVGGPRGWLQKLAGSGTQAHLAQRDGSRFNLPPELAVFPEATLNRQLYLWLAALGAVWEEAVAPLPAGAGWVAHNLAAAQAVAQQFPGLRPAALALVAAQQAQRPALNTLPPAQRSAEQAVQLALRCWVEELATPACPTTPALAPRERPPLLAADARPEPPPLPPEAAALHPQQVRPVWLWLAPDALEAAAPERQAQAPTEDAQRPNAPQRDATRRRARATESSENRAGLMMFFRAESILSWGEFVKVNRASDDDPDSDAARVADDFNELHIAQDGQSLAARVKFDLDLPSAAADDRPLGPGEPQPEWDWRQRRLLPDHCAVQRLAARAPAPYAPPPALRATARRVRRQLERLRAAPAWQRGRVQGEALDIDACVRHLSEQRAAPEAQDEPRVFAQRVRNERSLATLLLADLSQSTDAHVWPTPGAPVRGTPPRVIDVIREALYVFGEALAPAGDPFEMLGFSSVRRQHVRVHELKSFDAAWDGTARARVGAIRPGYYTRMGAAIRHATARLLRRPERQRLLLLLTDGKPNDLDHYEGRHGLEDTRHAVQAARQAGLTPFCISIDAEDHAVLPYLFGQHGFCHVHQPQQLVHRLAQVHAALTSGR